MTTHHHHTRPRSSFTTLSRALCALARSQFTRFVFLLAAIFPAVPSAHAVLRMNVQQVGNDVVATASGSVNTAGLSSIGFATILAPTLSNQTFRGGSGGADLYSGISGPASIGPGGGGSFASSTTGPIVGLTSFNLRIQVPQGYVSGTAIGPSTATYAGQTLATMGLTPGTYTYTWGSGGNADSAVVVVGGATTLRYTYTGTITSFTPQTTGTYAIMAYGAKGGNGSGNAGGTGARIAGDLALTSGESISVLVAGRGADSGSTGSGGGGSYVVRGVQTALIVAGGGGGGAFSPSSNNNKDASTGLNGQNSLFSFNGQFGAAGGTAGSGGSSVGSGAGLLGNGGSFGGIAFVNGGLAGIGTLTGGFGGGGAVAGSAGGGGGGYSGGAGGSVGTTSGGGGSFNAGTNQSNTIAANPDGSGHGLVEIAGAFVGLTPGQTYTLTYVVNNTTDLLNALAAIDLTGSSSGPGLDYTIVFGNNITLTQQLWAINLDTGSSLTIEGNGRFLDGADTYNGFFVYNGKVAIKNLTIRNAKARGGNGGNAAISGGGGAGLGGGLFVTSSGNVTLSNASFSGNSAQGGNGGTQIAFGYGGGGGLLGGNSGGSNGVLFGAGGGGGVGANGGAPGQPGSAGLLLGAASGGAGAAGASGGASAGGGGGGSAAGNGLNATAGGGGVTSSSAGGFGGGGGGSLNAAGSGGFGGGGAGSGSYLMSGNGGFGGGSGGTAFVVGASAGFGGGSTTSITGGGGLGAGGNIFVQQGGTLTALAGTFSQGTVTGGTGTSPGSAFGDGIFIQGDQSITLGAPTGQTLAVQGVIADQTGSGGTGGNAGAGTVVIDGGTGTVRLTAANTYTGGTTLRAGTFQIASNGSAGNGTITFASASATLAIDAALSGSGTFANTLAGLAVGNRIDLTGTPFITGAEAQLSGSTIVLTNGTVTQTFNLAAPLGAGLGVKVSANSATGTLLTVVTVPSITLNPPSATIQGTSNLGATVTFSATATDATDGTVPVTFTEGGNLVTSGSTFAIGAHTLTATATNSLGGTTTQTFTFTVVLLPITPTPGRYIGSGSDALGAFSYNALGFSSGYITIGGLRYSFLTRFNGTTKTVNAKRTGFTPIPVTISALTGDGVHAQLRLSYTDPLSNQLVEVDISRTAYDSTNPCPHAGNWKVAFRNSAAVGAPTVSAVANVAITSTGSVRITGSTASRRVFMRGTVMIDPASIPFYMNCILAPTQTVQGTLNFAGDSATGDLRWVVPAGAEADFANAIDEDYAAIGNRFTALPLAPQSGVFTLTNPGRTAGPVTGAATLQPTGMITGVPRVFALVSKGGGLRGFHIEAMVRTSFSGVYLPVNGEAIGFSRQGSNVGEVTFTPLR